MRFNSALFVLCILCIPSSLIGQTSVSAVAFDGIDDYISVADQPAWDLDSSDFTIETWIEFASVKTDDIFIGQDEGPGNLNKWIFGIHSGSLYFHINSPESGPKYPIAHSWTPATNTFYHLAVTRHRSDYFLFINGVIVATGNYDAVIPNVDHELTIGQAEGFYHHGTIDEVRIWKKFRTQTEIRRTMYATVHFSEPGLAALWRFDENSGATAFNAMNVNHGTLMNDPQWTTAAAPIASVTADQIISVAGEWNFTGASVFAAFQSKSGTDTIVVSKFGSMFSGSLPAGVTTLHHGYWTIQTTANGSFNADLTFGLGAQAVTLYDQEHPSNIKLFRRDVGSYGGWILAGTAVRASFGSATFEGITEFGEFAIGTSSDSPLSGTGGVFQSTASGIWGDAASWFLIGGSDDDGIPDADDDVIIRAGEHIQYTSGGYVNNILLLGGSAGTRLSIADNVGLYLYGILNSDGPVLSPTLVTTGASASINFVGTGRQIIGNRWSGDVAGWGVNISMSDTARVLTDFKAGALGVNSPIRFGTYESPTDLFIDGGTENSGTLSVNSTYLFVSGNITRTNTYTSRFNNFTASWSVIELGGTYLSAEQIRIGWPDYWYTITNTLRVRSTLGLLISTGSYSHHGTLEYIGAAAQTSGNELTSIANLNIKNPDGVQLLTDAVVTNLSLDTGNVSIASGITLSVTNLYAKTYSILGAGNIGISERVETAHPDGLPGTLNNSGTISLTNWSTTIVYNGSTAQQTGMLRSYFKDYPQQYISFIVQNPSGVQFNGSYYGNTLTLTNGNITVSAPDTLLFNTLNAGVNEIHGTGTYIHKPGQLVTSHPDGIDGTLQTTQFLFDTPLWSSIVLNGSVPQKTGLRMPDSLGGFSSTNTNDITFSTSVYIPGFDMNTLASGVVIPAGVTLRTSTFNSGPLHSISGGGNFMLTNGGSFSTQHAGGIDGALQLTGEIRLGDSAVFSLGEAGVPQTSGILLPDTVQSIYFSNASGTSISKPFHVRNIASIQNGTVDNSVHNFTLWEGAVLHRFAGGSITATPHFLNFYDVNYSGWSGATGPELPDSSTILRNLLGGNWITLSKNITVNGTIGNHLRTDSFTVRSMGTISPYMIVGHLSRFVNAPKEYVWEVADRDVQRYHPFSLIPSTMNDSGDVTVTLYDTAATPLPSLPAGQKLLRYYHSAVQSGISELNGNISMIYNDADVNSAGIPDDDSLQVMQWKDGTWKYVDVVVRDKYNNKLTAGPVDTLTTFIITGTEKKGVAAFSGKEIAFGSVLRPEYKYDTLYIKNTGTWPLQMNSLSFTDPWTFGGSLSSNTIPIGDSIAFVISFNAYHGGTSCVVYLYHNGTTGVDTVVLTGKAIYPDLTFSFGYPSFGTVPVGESKRDSVMIYNNGSYQLVISELVPTTPHFTAELEKDTIAAQDSGKLYITFAPQSEGTINAVIILRNNIYGSGDGYRIYPNGIATSSQFAVLPAELNFGTIHRGQEKKDSVQIKNTGTAVLHVTGVSASVAGYTVVPSSFDVPSGDSLWITVAFSPPTQGDFSGELIFTHSASTTSPDSVHLSGGGTEQIFTSDKTSFSFGSVTVGMNRTDSLFVTNTGNIPLSIASVISSDPEQFIVTPASAVLSVGAKQKFTFVFTPAALGTQSAKVKFTHDGIPDTNIVSVTGFGQIPIFTASRTVIEFGDVRLDSVRSDTLVVSNSGNMSLAVTSAAVSDSQVTMTPHSVILSPGAKKEFIITFAPKRTEGVRNVRIAFAHNGYPAADTITVTGRATAPHFTSDRLMVEFGGIGVGKNSTDSIAVKNTGTALLTIRSARSTDTARFSVQPKASVIAPSDSQWFRITYHATAMTEERSRIEFLHDADAGMDSIVVSGYGLMPKFTALSGLVDFGEVRVGKSRIDSAEIRNTGNAPLIVSSIAVNDSQYTADPDSFTLSPGAVAQVLLKFSPRFRGVTHTMIIIRHNAHSEMDTITLRGNGVEPLFSVDRKEIDFGLMEKDSIRTERIIVSNPGNALLSVDSVYSSEGMLRVSPENASIAPGDSLNVHFTFAPNIFGVFSGSVIVYHNGAGSPDSINYKASVGPPEFTSDRNTIHFRSTLVGNQRTDSIMILNSGYFDLTIDSAWVTDSSFRVAGIPSSLNGQSSVRLAVLFTPHTSGWKQGSVIISHNTRQKYDTLFLFGRALKLSTISEVRKLTDGSEAVIEGVMTRVKGGRAFIQDSTAALSILSAQSWWNDSLASGGIRMGDVVRIGGTMSESNYLRQFVADDSIEFIRLTRNSILPKPDSVSLAQLKTSGEQYESRLIRLKGASIVNTPDTVFLPQTSYSIVDASDSTQSVMLHIGCSDQTDLDGRRLPKKNFHFTGILSQFHLTDSSKGYHLLPLLNTDLESDPASVQEWAAGIPAQFILYNNFPNPFNPSTTIRFGVPEVSTVRIEIYDILGRRITELYHDRMEPGYQQVTWNARVSSGIYFYRIECVSVSRPDRKFTEIKKMLLIK